MSDEVREILHGFVDALEQIAEAGDGWMPSSVDGLVERAYRILNGEQVALGVRGSSV